MAHPPTPYRLSAAVFVRALTRAGCVLLSLLGLVLLPAPVASAGMIRDDRDPQAYVNLAANPAYASAGRLGISAYGTEFAGSGTLVSANWVLTAAHLFDGATGAEFTIGGQKYSASKWIAHPKWKGNLRRGYDLALVKLAAPVTNVAPARLYGGSRELGATATLLGFGQTGTGAGGARMFDEIQRAGQNVIDGMPGKKDKTYLTKLTKKARVFMVDFDNPRNSSDNATGSPQPLDLEYLISLGDSGGGAFADFGNGRGPVLVGVHSFGEMPDTIDDSDYGDVTGHVRVSRNVNWIRSVLRKQGDSAAAARLAADIRAARGGRELNLGASSFGTSALVPEPSSAALAGVLGVALLRRPARNRRRPAAL